MKKNYKINGYVNAVLLGLLLTATSNYSSAQLSGTYTIDALSNATSTN